MTRFWHPSQKIKGPCFSYGRTESGKCHTKGTKVLMSDGTFKEIEKLVVGDNIISPTRDYKINKVATVLDTHSHFDKDIYNIRIKRRWDNRVLYSCNGNHQVPLHDGKIVLAKDIKNRKCTTTSGAIDFGMDDLDIDPYSLGAWIGDGIFTYTNFSFAFGIKKKSILNYFRKKYPNEITSSRWDNLCHIISKKGKFSKQLKSVGLYQSNSGTKFIPARALRSSIKFRKELLAGLIDTDGYLNPKRGPIEYITKSKRLSEDIKFLVHSLGGFVYSRKTIKGYKKRDVNFKSEYYRISIYLDFDIPVKTPRIKKFKPYLRDIRKVPIIAERSKPQQVYGITIDSESELYIVNDFTITHNTWKNIAIVGLYHSKYRYKVWDIAPGKGNEGGFWCFPSDEEMLWAKFKSSAGYMKGSGPKEYKIKLLIPCFESKFKKEVPEMLPRIKTQIFSIYFKDITVEDISVLIGDVSKNAAYMWNSILKLPGTYTGEDILQYIDKKLNKYKELSIYKLFIRPAIDNNLLCSEKCENRLDLISEAKDRERVTILLHEWILSRSWGMFIMNFFMRRIMFDLAGRDKIHKENIAIFREAGDYMKVVDKSAEGGEQTQIFRNNVTNIARYGRRGLILFMDTQSPKDVKNLIEGQEDLLCINEISSLEISELIGKLKSERRISKRIRDNLHNLRKDQIVLVERQKKAVWIDSFMPPRCMCYKNKSFLKLWEEKYNSYKKVSEDIKYVIEENKRSKDNKKVDEIVEEVTEKIKKTRKKKAIKVIEEPMEEIEDEFEKELMEESYPTVPTERSMMA